MGNNNGKYLRINPKKQKRKKFFRNATLSILLAVLSLILVVLVVGVIYYNSVLNQINRFDENQQTLSSEEIESVLKEQEIVEDTEPVENIGTLPVEMDSINEDEEVIGGRIINVLLIGQDSRSGHQMALSDSMILISVNTETKKMVMTSFLRDLYIEIPGSKGGYYTQRMNTAYSVGGMEKLNATIKHNFGVEVDNNIEVDFSGFKNIVDTLGGLDIELTGAEARHMNRSFPHWTFAEGVNHMNGEQALEYARIRKIDNDFVRTERQRTVLGKLFDKVKNMGLTDILGLAKTVIPMITTDMTNSEITGYILELAPILSELEIVTQRVPVDGTWWNANAGTKEEPMYVICCDLATNRKFLRDTIGVLAEE